MMDLNLPTSESAQPEEVIRVGEHSYVLAVSSRTDDRTRVLKHGDTFAIFDQFGDILASGMRDQGLYHSGTRFLSRLDLMINQLRPLLLSSNLERENVFLDIDMTNPDLVIEGKIVAPRGTVHLLRSALVWEGTLHEAISLRNFGATPLSLRLGLHFGSDFADIFEVRGVRRARKGRILEPQVAGGQALLRYDGLDGVRRTTVVSSDIPAEMGRMRADQLDIDIRLDPGKGHSFDVCFSCLSEPIPATTETTTSTVALHRELQEGPNYATAVERARARVHSMREREAQIETDNGRFNDWVRRSYADLRLMITETSYGPYPYAGVPWFSTPFGRDGIITALQTLWVSPEIARGVLSYLAATQADEVNSRTDAESGKILHELRHGEMSATGEVPYARYYGSVDATPLFVLLAGEYLKFSGDLTLIQTLWPHIERALTWVESYGDHNLDGFIDYQAAEHGGLVNQGWKDSHNSIFHENGELASPPVALCEVQGYAYAALCAGAEIAGVVGQSDAALAYAAKAQMLKRRFNEQFWDEQLGSYVLAIDGHSRACRVVASNAGHLLFTGIAEEDHARRIIDDMLSPRFFTGWGVRTLANDQPRYNPMSYHNGSVWPHDTAMIALGMARYGRADGAAKLMSAMFDVSTSVDLHRLPELFCGFPRRAQENPIGYPVACAPQAWAAGALFMLLQACLGLRVRGDRSEVNCEHPVLPDFLRWVRVEKIRAGHTGATIDLIFRRVRDDVGVNVMQRSAGVGVVVTK